LVEASWDEALREAAMLVSQADGRAAVFGTGLLTHEEGWMVARLADGIRAGSPIFDVVPSPKVEIDADSLVASDELDRADVLVAIGPTESYEKISVDAILRQAMIRGVRLISLGARVPGATAELPAETTLALLGGLRDARSDATPDDQGVREAVAAIGTARRVVFVVGSRAVDHDALEAIAGLVKMEPRWKMLLVPATANGIGLRRLGFVENLIGAASVWISVGSDPVSTAAGRRYLLDVEALIAVSSVPNATTERAQIVLPMRTPIETRGRVVGMRGERELVQAAHSPLGLETWEVVGRLATALGVKGLPEQYDGLADIVGVNMGTTACAVAVAGSTPASLAARMDRALGSLLEGAA
ncbi:hypothetical protein JW848_04140, partial [Candidatus Bipolaricaulota bacterium]|nr:hypothetical protein [Candidatus Bipolaricaulota bacterium]